MDSFELNKIAGAVLFALLILFGTRTAADIIFAVHAPEKPGWEVAIPESTQGPATAEGKKTEPIAVRLASASADKGEAVHKKCTTCHSFDAGGANKIGPNLHDVVGGQMAAHEGFAYSDALKSKGGTWGYEELDHFLANPKGYVPGTKMAFAGVKNDGQRADLIMYLRSLKDNPPPLPEPPAEGEKAAAEGGEKPAAEGGKPAEGEKPAAKSEKPAAGENGKPAATEDSKPAAPDAKESTQPESAPANEAKPQDKQTPPATPGKPEGETPAQDSDTEKPAGESGQQGEKPADAPARSQ